VLLEPELLFTATAEGHHDDHPPGNTLPNGKLRAVLILFIGSAAEPACKVWQRVAWLGSKHAKNQP
jgi:hypothetical protein